MSGKRGAPYGNLNALQHGGYSRRYKIEEKIEISEEEGNLLDRVIAMNYEQLLRLFDYTEVAENPKRFMAAVNLFLRVLDRLIRLMTDRAGFKVKKQE